MLEPLLSLDSLQARAVVVKPVNFIKKVKKGECLRQRRADELSLESCFC